MKRLVYITAFIFLGILVATLIHAGLEIPALYVMTEYPERFADTFLWQEWDAIHRTVSTLLWFAGLGIGWWCGVRFWQILYVEKRYGEKKW